MIVVALVMLGVAVGALPFAPWFVAESPAGRVSATAIETSGDLWALPALGGAIVVGALLLAAHRGGRIPTGVVVVAATLAAAWTLAAILQPPAHLTLEVPGSGRIDVPREVVGVGVDRAAYLTLTAAALCGLLGFVRELASAARPRQPGSR